MKRRDFLAVAAATTGALSGCIGGGGGNGDQETRIEIRNDEFVSEGFTRSVQGTAVNVSDETLSQVQVTVRFFDENDEQLDKSTDSTSSMEPDEEWEFEALFNGNADDVDDYEISTSVTV